MKRPQGKQSDKAFARALLRSAELDQPPEETVEHVVRALGIGAVTLTSAGVASGAIAAAGTAAAKAGFGISLKFLVLGAVAGTLVAAGVGRMAASGEASSRSRVAESETVSASPPAGPAREAVVHAVAASLPTASPPPDPPEGVRASRPSDELGGSSDTQAVLPAVGQAAAVAPGMGAITRFPDQPPPPPTEPAAPGLSEEVRTLDAARQQLAQGRSSEALTTLDRYRRAWPRGVLATEAQVLRVEALVRLGRHDAALQEAQPLMLRDPRGRHAARVRALLGLSE